MDRRNIPLGWITTHEECASLFVNGNVIADIEYYAAAYWRITYYDKVDGKVRLRFAFEDSQLSQATIRLKVEAIIKEARRLAREEKSCSNQTLNENIRTPDLPAATSVPTKVRYG